jgi:hypothetical protein
VKAAEKNQSTHYMSHIVPPRKHAVYEIIMQNISQPFRATDDVKYHGG